MPETLKTVGDTFSFRNSTLRDVLAAHREKIAELEAEFGEDTPGVLIARAGTILLEKWAEDELGESILDATVYRSCPECGGSRLVPDPETVELGDDGEFHIDDMEMVPCPVCADAPTAIVSAALREKAKDAVWALYLSEYFEKAPSGEWLRATVDAVLSTVLGHVRYGEVVVVDSPAIDGEEYWVTEEWRIHQGDTIAILEDVDSIDTSAAHVESAATNRQEAGKEGDG